MSLSEGGKNGAQITAEILLEFSNGNTRLWRMNAGMGWVGRLVSNVRGTVTLANARAFHAMPEDWPDIGGYTRPDPYLPAIPVYIEVKGAGDRLRPGQASFIDLLRSMGCRAGVARSVEDARKIIAGN